MIVILHSKAILTHGHVVGGVLYDAKLQQQNPSTVTTVAAPKLHGACHLSKLAGLLPTSHCNLFSSTSALLCPPGQANYSSSNAQVDALASCMERMGMSLDKKMLTTLRRMMHMRNVFIARNWRACQRSVCLKQGSTLKPRCSRRLAGTQHCVGCLGNRYGGKSSYGKAT